MVEDRLELKALAPSRFASLRSSEACSGKSTCFVGSDQLRLSRFVFLLLVLPAVKSSPFLPGLL